MDTYAEQFIKDYTNHCSNELCAVEDKFGKKVISYREWLTPDQALRAVEIAKERMIGKMEQFLYEELNNGDIECRDMEFLIGYFKKYMEE